MPGPRQRIEQRRQWIRSGTDPEMRAHRKTETKHQDDDGLDPKDAARGSKQEAPVDRDQSITDRQDRMDQGKSPDPFRECESAILSGDFQDSIGAPVDLSIAADDVDVFLDSLALERQALLGMHVVQVEFAALRRMFDAPHERSAHGALAVVEDRDFFAGLLFHGAVAFLRATSSARPA